ncbi:MAG TPA: hypothetical protein VFN78_01850 [Ktedonobacterales bacterium]|nr:hypothetical protein [Ktedonobacterales bacterium]
MDTAFERFRRRSIAAYICLFGAYFGDVVYGESHGEVALWLVMGCVGVILVVIRNISIPTSQARWRMFLADGLALCAMQILHGVLSVSLGLARGVVFLLAASIYISLFTHLLYGGRIIARAAATR